jgi:type VI secretion system VasD/TssJ family lipoprotein
VRRGISTVGVLQRHQQARGNRAPGQLALIGFVAVALLGVGCAGGPKPSEVCLSLVASPHLNKVDGEPHVVVISFYPLQNVSAFNTTDPTDLLNGVHPPGLTGDPWEVTIYPGEIKKLEEQLPRDTAFVGLVADFYHGPSRTVVEADCAAIGDGTRIVLTSNDLRAE